MAVGRGIASSVGLAVGLAAGLAVGRAVGLAVATKVLVQADMGGGLPDALFPVLVGDPCAHLLPIPVLAQSEVDVAYWERGVSVPDARLPGRVFCAITSPLFPAIAMDCRVDSDG